MSTQQKYYLARNKKTFGPLSHEEVETLRRSGQITQYSWIFQQGDLHWNPIDPPPALPQGGEASAEMSSTSPASEPVREAPRAQARVHRIGQETYRVILFDHRNAVSGWLVDASDGSCEIHSDQDGSDPLFVPREIACLTLHDTRTGDSIKLRVRVSEMSRAGHGWTYRLRWNAAPELLVSSGDRSIAA